jgi:kynurenine 3-monooxygenase
VNALHIWPRGGFMLIALPNPDATFTATLFLARRGANSFEELGSASAVDAFFAREFPGAKALMPDLLREFFEHPQGSLGTVYTQGWHLERRRPAVRRCRARHRAVSWPGNELRVRGLRRTHAIDG